MNFESALEILGLGPHCHEDEVRKAYRSKALEFHPDRNHQNPEAHWRMLELNQAHNLLLTKFMANSSYQKLEDKKVRNEKDYVLYKQAMTFFKRIHPSTWVKISEAGLFDPSGNEEKLPFKEGVLDALASIGSAFSVFSQLINDFPDSKWKPDALEKLTELEKMATRYRTMLKNNPEVPLKSEGEP